MIILTQLTATAETGEITETRGTVASVQDEPAKGFFRAASLGADALYLKRGKEIVAIPRAELFKLAEAACPAFIPPAQPKQ